QSAITPQTMLLYAIGVVVFFAIFMACTRFEMRRGLFARFIPNIGLSPSAPALLISIAVLLGLALIAALPQAGYFGLLGFQFRSGLAASAVCLATSFLLAQRFNPMSWAVFGVTFAVGAL